MKKLMSLAIIFIFVLSLSAGSAFADDMTRKLGRGVANVVTCPLEITKSMSDVNNESGPFAGLTWGLARGLVKTVIRGGVGFYEVFTFPVANPEGYKPILNDPEFFAEND